MDHHPPAPIHPPQAVYLSPHFDDIALSCGGLAAAQAGQGTGAGLCITLFAGPPTAPLHAYAQRLHDRWGEPDPQAGNRLRRAEDAAALAGLGLVPVWLPWGDAIYRPAPYIGHAAIFGEVAASEHQLPGALAGTVQAVLREYAVAPGTPLYIPLGVGHHVDHQLTRLAGLALGQTGWPILFYEDYPYAAQPGVVDAEVAGVQALIAPARLVPQVYDIAPHLAAKIAAILAYNSQISSLFPSPESVPAAVRAYAAEVGAPHGLAAAERYWRVEE